PQEL
ncbi:hypothetical protein D043_1542B, partial [Vibrio parahaemolyticus EKP-021]